MIEFSSLFSSVVLSVIWCQEPYICKIWVTLIALMDRDGIVRADLPRLAELCHVTEKQCARAIKILTSPDPTNITEPPLGCRLEAVGGGWRMIHHVTYHKVQKDAQNRASNAKRVQAFRSRQPKGR